MSIKGSNNPFPCQPVIFSAGNSIISLGTITRSIVNPNEFTFSVGFVWKINGTTYQNVAPIVLTIEEAADGFLRIDNALLNTSNTIELQQGLPSETIALQPTYPETNILLTSWNISGDTIGDEESPSSGGEFVKKDFDRAQIYNGSGSNIVIPLNPNGYSNIYLTGTITSVDGFDFSELIANPSIAEYPHEGKPFRIYNRTSAPITLNHEISNPMFFQFRNTENFVLPVGESVQLVNNSYSLVDVDKSFNTIEDIIALETALAGKLYKVSTVDVEKVYVKNADGSQSTKPTSDFGTVKGTGTTNRISKFTESGTIADSQIFDDGTNVGIGTTSPQARLDVIAQGALSTDIAFRVRNSTDTRNFLAVNGAGDVFNNGAGGGETNTHFGENTARARTGNYNSTFGNQAGMDLTTGSSNTLFGYNAGRSITTASGNVFIGERAGELNNANNTVAIGSNALSSNISGLGNTAVGVSSLNLTTAAGNTAVGNGSGINNTIGQRNTFIGMSSGVNNTTGQRNVYLGAEAGLNQTTGNDNFFVGDGSGRYEADGVTNLTTATNSLFIGNNTRGNASGQTNQIVIGHAAIGDGSNSVVLGNSSITRTRLQGQVIIGTFATPPTGIEGAIYYDSAKKKHYGFDGITWNPLY